VKDYRLYLIHIKECIEKIESYVLDGKDAFLDTPLIQDGVLRNLQTLAESTKNLPDNIKASHPEIDWRRVVGFRNILVHDYLGVDIERVWLIIEKDLPGLKRAIEEMIRESKN
jgi:uncharacterized protein with HEPN domain